MRTYSLDIDPEQLVLWTRTELGERPSRLTVAASCRREVRAFDKRQEFRFGDAESEDLAEVAIVAALEISPAVSKDGWSISVLIEDETGLRIPDEGSDGGDEEMDLETFFGTFIRPDRGTVYVTANVEDAAAQARLTRLLGNVLENRHRGSNPR
ncbi:hypothetical protein [Roseibium aggregatum]|uniref:Uncharacterized protein n=1 Tax=Roseibium aggregatum TaxID=187304 RepID=A0A926NV05_9HYPH|nr:hypothetical protein [Roseibium aggregatum]MBD1544906.1 hypothetical protein [Roseibium aggregatum]